MKPLLACGILTVITVLTTANGAPPPSSLVEGTAPLPDAVTKPTPENVADLKAIQEQVKVVLKKAMPATVAIKIRAPDGQGFAAGSGVIISEDGYVLTAGHISMEPNKRCNLIFPDGKSVKGETLGHNRGRDAGLIKITDKGPWPYVKMADSDKVKQGAWCLTVGHPGGYKPGRPPVVRLGRILALSKERNNFLQTDTPLVGGDSGGPLFDLNGHVLGIHSWISQEITGNRHVPVNVYKNDWDRLVAGEEWGRDFGGPRERGRRGAYLGIGFDRDTDDLKLSEVIPQTPASRAGLKVGDVLASVDGTKMTTRDDLKLLLNRKRPGETVKVTVERDGKQITIDVKLARSREEDE